MWAVNGGGMASRIWGRAIATAAAIGLMIPAAAIGQTKGGTPAPATGSSGSTTGSTGTTSPNPGRTTTPATTNPNNTPSSGNLPQPIFISGRVMTEDGTPPPDPVTMETVCNGSPHAEGYSDSRGYFAIELGARNAVIQDASEFTTRDNWNR